MIATDSVESPLAGALPAEGVLVATDSKGRVRVSKEQRKAVLAKFEQSGMSAAKFAAVAGIKYSTFAGWVQRYRRAKPKAALRRLRLLEAVVDPSHGQEQALEANSRRRCSSILNHTTSEMQQKAIAHSFSLLI